MIPATSSLDDRYKYKPNRIIMNNQSNPRPDHTAIRVALWRSLHVLIDPPPHIFIDKIGEKIVGEKDWLKRADMDPNFSKSMRASIVVRARFVEDLVHEEIKKGTTQYVILGSGLDTFAFRNPELENKVKIFEIDQPEQLNWKINRLNELGMKIPNSLNFVPVDFEAGESWLQKLKLAGLNPDLPSIVVSTGVSMYLSHETNLNLLKEVSTLSKNTVFAMTFMLSLDLLEGKEKSVMEFVMNRAKEAGTPFLSLFRPEELLNLAKEATLANSQIVTAKDLYEKYLRKRNDHLDAGTAECFLVSKV